MAQLLRLAYYDSGTSQDLAMLFISFRATVRYQYFNGLDVYTGNCYICNKVKQVAYETEL